MPLVTLEGIDKAGKSTVLNALREEFPEAVFTTEPYEPEAENMDNEYEGAWTGEIVREVLKGEREADEFGTFAMFLADHLHHVESLIGPALDEGKLVICDRYMDSRYAYQQEALRNIVPEGDTLNWIQNIQEGQYAGTIKPDLTLLLDISVEESLRRQGEDPTERFEKSDFLENARNNYLEIAEDEPERYEVIDAEQSKELVRREVLEAVKTRV